MTNGPGKTGYYAKRAYDLAAQAMDAVEHTPALVPATSSADGYMTKEYAGKLDGVEAGANAYTHPDSGVTADTYQSVTVDAKGHVTAATKSTAFMQTLNAQGTDAEKVRTLIGAGTGEGEASAISMTGYKKASSPAAVTENDNVLTAIGKLEAKPSGSDEAADINMTNYVKPGSYTPVSASDSVLIAIGKIEARPAGVLPQIMVTAPTGCTVTATNDGTTLTAIESSGTYELDVPNFGDWTVTCAKTIDGTPYSTTKVVSVLEVRRYEVDMHYAHRYGFRISKTESSPAGAVEYIFDAEGMTPAHMDFANGVFDYGDWGNVWFVTDNKPLMLKSNGTVDYYLDPNDYDKKVDGTSSDVANTSYDGNAMAQFPLVWVKRYEDSDYWYEIVSNAQVDSSYKAYAHTRTDGSIAPYFYYAMFRGSGNASKIRSLSGQTLAGSLTAANEIAGCTANGSLWYTQTWSQYQLIRTLLMLIGKSRDARSVFGTGNARGASSASGLLQTGTLKTMGQFYGYDTNNQQVKVFHCEAPWGEQRLRIAGLITNSRKVYAKMTREGEGYKVTDVTGYDDTGITIPSFDASYIKSVVCSDYGMIPIASGGSSSTYFCCPAWSASSMIYPSVGGGANDTATYVGFSTIYAHAAASTTGFRIGCGLSCEMPVPA